MNRMVERKAPSQLEELLEALHKLMPPQTLIHVGAGGGKGPLQAWHRWDIPQVHVIDADASRLAWAERLAAEKQGWRIDSAVVGGESGPCTWFKTSNADEDGLIAPNTLQAIWQGLTEKHSDEAQCITLDQLASPADNANGSYWLLVDCLPALPILDGATAWLANTSVVCVRALIQDVTGLPESATLAAIENKLSSLGFREVLRYESNHPALCHAVFARDWLNLLRREQEVHIAASRNLEKERKQQSDEHQAALAQITKDRDEQVKLAADRLLQVQQLTKARDELEAKTKGLESQSQDASQKCSTLEQELANLNSMLNEERNQGAQLKQARDQQEKANSEIKVEVANLTRARDEQAKLAGHRQLQLQQATKARDDLAATVKGLEARLRDASQKLATHEQELAKLTGLLEDERKLASAIQQACDQQGKLALERQAEIVKLTVARDEQAKLAAERQAQVQQATRERDELVAKLRTLEEKQKVGIEKLTALEKTSAGQAAKVGELQNQVVAVTKARDELDIKVKEFSRHRDEQTKQIAVLQSELQGAKNFVKDSEGKLANMKAELVERDNRQQLLNDEILRAEAQIDLIKDVLLRETGL